MLQVEDTWWQLQFEGVDGLVEIQMVEVRINGQMKLLEGGYGFATEIDRLPLFVIFVTLTYCKALQNGLLGFAFIQEMSDLGQSSNILGHIVQPVTANFQFTLLLIFEQVV